MEAFEGCKVGGLLPSGGAFVHLSRLERVGFRGGEYRFDSLTPRVHRGDTRWPVIVARFPPLLAHRSGVGGTVEARGGGGKGIARALPVLQGDQGKDMRLLAGVQPCLVY